MSGLGSYKIGKGKPPVEHQFKKGEPSRNPKGRRKVGAIDVVAFFNAPVSVDVDGRKKKLHPFEVALTNIAQRAIKNSDMRAAKRFLMLCEEAGLLVDPNKGHGGPVLYRISNAWETDEWMDNFRRLGPPPWPGARDGLFREKWREEVLADVG